MDRGYTFSPDLLQMMLVEERQKFVSALGKASLKELTRIRKNIEQISSLLDSAKISHEDRSRYNEHDGR